MRPIPNIIYEEYSITSITGGVNEGILLNKK